jgi:hypothetical protein
MSKTTKTLSEAITFAFHELRKINEVTHGARLNPLLTDSMILEVEHAFGVSGSVQVRIQYDGEGFTPSVETSFPSQHRGGMEMVLFAQLVQELTAIAVRLQVQLDQFEIVRNPPKT